MIKQEKVGEAKPSACPKEMSASSSSPGDTASIVFDAPKATLPADETSDVTVTLTARDMHNNLVADGAPVAWENGGLGEITAIDNETTNGQARATITAGFLDKDQTIDVQVDSFEASFTIPNNPIHVTVTSGSAQLSVVDRPESSIPTTTTITAQCVDTSGIPVADGAVVTFFASNGSWADSSFGAVARVPASGGCASAILNAQGYRAGSVLVAAGVTNFAGSMRLPFVPPVSGMSVTADKGVLSGDASVDGTIPMKQLDGTTHATPYYTSVTAKIAGGVPNAQVTIKLSGAGAQLVELPGGSSVTLDSQGNAIFAIKSKGNFVPGVAPQGLLIAVSEGTLTAQTLVKVVSRQWYASLNDFASVFAWGDPHGSAATAADFATGMLCSGSTRDIAPQIANWATGKKTTYTQMGYAAAGIVMDFFPKGSF